jgi:riboflavin kinase/FMN adenylyltransferase
MEYTTTLSTTEPIAITIGNFDGVHRGHQNLMHELCVLAQERGCKPVLVTFSPHTLAVVRPDIDLLCLTTLEEKLTLTKLYGHIADNIVIAFTPEVKAMSAQEFMDNLREHFTIRGIVVGANFSFGRHRMGQTAFLQHYGQEHDMQVRIIPLEEADQTRVSSTYIRTLVSEGQVSKANDLLGHPVTISGIVVHGDHRGRLLGVPTANLAPEAHKLLPADGVYAARIYIGDPLIAPDQSNNVYNGVVNIGVRPTFDGQERHVEAVLFDIDIDLYDQRLTIEFIARLRGEQRFAGIDALKAQIAVDMQHARQLLQ